MDSATRRTTTDEHVRSSRAIGPHAGWYGSVILGILLLVPCGRASGQSVTPDELEAAIVAGNWQLLARNQNESGIGHFCRAVGSGVLMEWRIMEAEGKKTISSDPTINQFCQRILEHNPNNAFVRFVVATRYLDTGDAVKAMAEYEKSAELNPRFAAVPMYQIGTWHGRRGNRAEQIKWTDKSIAADPTYAPAYVAKGTLLKDQDRFDDATAMLKQATEILASKKITSGEQLGRAYYNWGWILINRPTPDNDQGILVLSSAIKADPLRLEAYNELGIAYKRKNMFAEAIATYKEGIAKGDNSATIYFNLGVSEYRSGHTKEAVAAFEKASSLEPNGQMGTMARQWLTRVR
jgi:tetratricopeptide (TPR) repeat protein